PAAVCEPTSPADIKDAPASVADVVAALEALAAKPAEEIMPEDAARLKQQFYAMHNAAQRAAREKFIAEGGAPEAYVPEADPQEEQFKTLMNVIKDKKAAMRAEIEQQQARNLTAKKEIIDQIIAMASDADNVNRHYQAAKDLQAKFKEIGDVPPSAMAETWKAYQDAVERFYDQLKINMELRDYDFKKNLAEKQQIIEEAEKLTDAADVVAAFRSLQTLHDKWRVIGPVAKDLREEIWAKFKDASGVINKRYQDYFEERKAREQENETAKTALCERVEGMDFSANKNYSAWDEMTKAVIAAQEEWKKLGFANKKVNNQLFARFREACDKFFAAKAQFFKDMKDELAENLRRKTALAERAEALKESTEWQKASEELVALQKEWKTIGAVAKKHSDAIWKRFHDACDYFFEQKKKATGNTRAAEQANLKAKLELIERLKAITTEMPREEAIARFKEVQAEWPAIGHVPFKDKDRIYDTYRELNNKLYRELDIRGTQARMANFAESIGNISDSDKLYRERERLARACESRRSELHTYENNMGFLSSKSKNGDQMVREMQRKISRLKEDIASLEEKIKLIDSKI
ncbi:MAG: DUF349 domain-containing protein, partial [Muribaculaceae bacterium]|nr:DUF349 domain-containing protein [Muribaculaceae bacterium]